MSRLLAIPPHALSRIGGVSYLFVILLGVAQQVLVRNRIFVGGAAAATAANLRSLEPWWRAGVVMELTMLFATVVLAVVLYALLRRVDGNLALLATSLCFVAIAVEAAYVLHALESLFPLGEAAYLQAWSPEQRDAMAHLAARSYVLGFGIALLLFSPFFAITGFLIYHSGFVPRTLGVLYAIAGAGYLTYGLALVLAPAVADRLFVVIAGPAFVGEASLCMWLLVRGVATDTHETPTTGSLLEMQGPAAEDLP